MSRLASRHFVRAIALAILFAGNSLYAAPGNGGSNNGIGESPDWQKEWYLRLTVESPQENLRDRGNVLGQLHDSVDDLDSHDLIELKPFAAPYLTLVFPHPDWAESGNYSSDYHDTNYTTSDQWEFQVHSDNSQRNVDLYWGPVMVVERNDEPKPGERGWSKSPQNDNAERLINRMRLEDTQTGDVIRAVVDGKTQSYSFNMSGSTVRTFRWVLEDKNGHAPRSSRRNSNKNVEMLRPSNGENGNEPPAVGRYR